MEKMDGSQIPRRLKRVLSGSSDQMILQSNDFRPLMSQNVMLEHGKFQGSMNMKKNTKSPWFTEEDLLSGSFLFGGSRDCREFEPVAFLPSETD
jgi:hypothetical protein